MIYLEAQCNTFGLDKVTIQDLQALALSLPQARPLREPSIDFSTFAKAWRAREATRLSRRSPVAQSPTLLECADVGTGSLGDNESQHGSEAAASTDLVSFVESDRTPHLLKIEILSRKDEMHGLASVELGGLIHSPASPQSTGVDTSSDNDDETQQSSSVPWPNDGEDPMAPISDSLGLPLKPFSLPMDYTPFREWCEQEELHEVSEGNKAHVVESIRRPSPTRSVTGISRSISCGACKCLTPQQARRRAEELSRELNVLKHICLRLLAKRERMLRLASEMEKDNNEI